MLIGTAAFSATASQAVETASVQEEAEVPIRLRSATSVLSDRLPSPTTALEIVTPDPDRVVRLAQGRPALLQFGNDSSAQTGFAFVGLRGWGAADVPPTLGIAAIGAGDRKDYQLKPSDSGTALVRAIASPGNEAQRGAVGVLVVAEATAPSIDSDRVLLVQDWLLGADGQLRFGSVPPADAVERVITVNGRAVPGEATLAPGARVRLRLVNGSVQRVMLIACEGVTPAVVAIDGQPSALFSPARGMVPIGPGARVDLMADLPDASGQEARVVLRGTERIADVVEPDRTLLTLRTAGVAREKRPPIGPLPPNQALPQAIPLEAARRIDLAFAKRGDARGAWTVNGAAGGAAPLMTVRQGDAITLGFINTSPLLVPIRVQGQAMRVLHAKDDGWDPYWRDSVLLPPGSRTHVAFVADAPGRWAIESGFDDQLLAGLRCWFAVTPR